MKTKKIIIFFAAIFFILTHSFLFTCTMFKATKDGKVLVGNNEDWKDPYTKIIFKPAAGGKFGGIYFCFADGEPQGGMNDRGLVFDGFATSAFEVVKSKNREIYRGNLVQKVMDECETIEEVIKNFNRYNLQWMKYCQLMFVDKTGDSVIIEGDVFHRKKGGYQVVTNFYLSKLKKKEDITDPRYLTAIDLLHKNDVSLKTCRTVLAAVHQEGSKVNTMYSNIYDPRSKSIYLYHFHNFENVIVLDLEKELKKGKRMVDLPGIFPRTYAAGKYKKTYDKDRTAKLPPIIELDPSIYDLYAGGYEYSPGYIFNIKKENKRLFIYTDDMNKHELFPQSQTRFFTKQIDAKITFNKDESGKVTAMILDYGGKRTCKKID